MTCRIDGEYLIVQSDHSDRSDTPAIDLTREEVQQLRQFIETHHKWLRPNKDWGNCPYEGHHDTCDCRGMGGDR